MDKKLLPIEKINQVAVLSSVEAMIDEAGKAQGAEYKSKLDVILTLRKKARDDLDALKDRLSPSRNY